MASSDPFNRGGGAYWGGASGASNGRRPAPVHAEQPQEKRRRYDGSGASKVLFIPAMPERTPAFVIRGLFAPFAHGRPVKVRVERQRARAQAQAFIEMPTVESAGAAVAAMTERPPQLVAGTSMAVEFSAFNEPVVEETEIDPSPVLIVAIHKEAQPVDIDLMHMLASRYGRVLRIAEFTNNLMRGDTMQRVTQFLIQFATTEEATTALMELHGRQIWRGCNELEVEFSRTMNLEQRPGNAKFRDFSVEVQAQAQQEMQAQGGNKAAIDTAKAAIDGAGGGAGAGAPAGVGQGNGLLRMPGSGPQQPPSSWQGNANQARPPPPPSASAPNGMVRGGGGALPHPAGARNVYQQQQQQPMQQPGSGPLPQSGQGGAVGVPSSMGGVSAGGGEFESQLRASLGERMGLLRFEMGTGASSGAVVIENPFSRMDVAVLATLTFSRQAEILEALKEALNVAKRCGLRVITAGVPPKDEPGTQTQQPQQQQQPQPAQQQQPVWQPAQMQAPPQQQTLPFHAASNQMQQRPPMQMPNPMQQQGPMQQQTNIPPMQQQQTGGGSNLIVQASTGPMQAAMPMRPVQMPGTNLPPNSAPPGFLNGLAPTPNQQPMPLNQPQQSQPSMQLPMGGQMGPMGGLLPNAGGGGPLPLGQGGVMPMGQGGQQQPGQGGGLNFPSPHQQGPPMPQQQQQMAQGGGMNMMDPGNFPFPREMTECGADRANVEMTPVIAMQNLPTTCGLTARMLFNLVSHYGIVHLVKIVFKKTDTALVQFASPHFATLAVHYLKELRIEGKDVNVSFSRNKNVQGATSQDPGSKDRNFIPVPEDQRFREEPEQMKKILKSACRPQPVVYISNLEDEVTESTISGLMDRKVARVVMLPKEAGARPSWGRKAHLVMESVEDGVAAVMKLHFLKRPSGRNLLVSFSRSRPGSGTGPGAE
uniref:RRM domain-containing protein n=1 Tax=Chromera velia CCMP2878 TaxID=1169474 RepID=A0A0G4FQ23_9ALVE|eukprot:Cvel_18119.t1-p1 / transcript=Cvel_18119.t1 / gene=Cvel_18119 / organism=Chromera_velia_CCMP2878 / gene_product=Polypyrimidine tract-binding protein homolog 3, putative / transcript_product=Polypyrimidine tract-binding protein homolog 3, putative / location=Cvel_scaffold1486:21992-31488(+) / protein_length=927 / sequence_SO=supercontig / SO=protein_coding / is_pseudo=false